MKFETDGLFDLDVPDGYNGESMFNDDYPIEDDDYDYDEYDNWDYALDGYYDPDPLDEEMGYDDPDYDDY